MFYFPHKPANFELFWWHSLALSMWKMQFNRPHITWVVTRCLHKNFTYCINHKQKTIWLVWIPPLSFHFLPSLRLLCSLLYIRANTVIHYGLPTTVLFVHNVHCSKLLLPHVMRFTYPHHDLHCNSMASTLIFAF